MKERGPCGKWKEELVQESVRLASSYGEGEVRRMWLLYVVGFLLMGLMFSVPSWMVMVFFPIFMVFFGAGLYFRIFSDDKDERTKERYRSMSYLFFTLFGINFMVAFIDPVYAAVIGWLGVLALFLFFLKKVKQMDKNGKD